jgi:hypothetical protein
MSWFSVDCAEKPKNRNEFTFNKSELLQNPRRENARVYGLESYEQMWSPFTSKLRRVLTKYRLNVTRKLETRCDEESRLR